MSDGLKLLAIIIAKQHRQQQERCRLLRLLARQNNIELDADAARRADKLILAHLEQLCVRTRQGRRTKTKISKW